MQRIIPAIAAAFVSLFMLTAPAAAQSDPDDAKINQLIIYGNDPCPESTADQITVCARKEESERYRIPEILRHSDNPANDAWNNKVLAYEAVLDNGTLSCSPSGAGGWTGCSQKMIEQAYAEKKTDASVRFSQLIAEERAKRLSTTDATAAAEQKRVDVEEKQYFEKQAEEKAGAKAGEKAASAPAPAAPATDNSGK